MAETGENTRGGFGRGFGGRGRNERGTRGARGARRGGRDGEKSEWVPCTKLGRLVRDGKINSLEEIYLHSLPIKETQIIDRFFPGEKDLVDEVMKIMPVQKQTHAGQRTRFKAYVAVGDQKGHLGLGCKSAKEVAGAIQGAIRAAKLALIPVRRGYWGAKLGQPHTVPMKIHGKCGSVRVRLIPAPRGTGIVGAPVTKKLLHFAGISDCFTCTSGHSRTRGNFMYAAFDALSRTYGYLTPEFWKPTHFVKSPYQEWSDYLVQSSKRGARKE